MPIGIRVRERLQQHVVDDGENGGRRADAERERDEAGGREAGTAAEEAERVADVLDEPLERRAAPGVARHFLHERDIAELPVRRVRGLVGRRAALDAIRRGHREVRADFLVEFGFASPAPEGQSHASLSRFVRLRMPAMASEICCQRDRSTRSCLRPAGVRR